MWKRIRFFPAVILVNITLQNQCTEVWESPVTKFVLQISKYYGELINHTNLLALVKNNPLMIW